MDTKATPDVAVEQGPITKEYKANSLQIVKDLNRLHSTEITSYLQYKQHSYMGSGVQVMLASKR